MKRRHFLITSGLASLALTANPGCFTARIRTAGDLNRFLRDLYAIPEPSCDRIIVGDPDTVIKKVGTVWMPYWNVLREAVSRGVNAIVVHEPTFYTHWDLDVKDFQVQSYYDKPSPAREQYVVLVEEKRQWIEHNGLVIIRSHDVMDILKEFGMPYALGQKLGFSNESIIRSRNYYNVYRVPEDSAVNVAKSIAAALADFNQPGVAFYGDPEKQVSSVGMGAGCICDPQEFADMNPDMYIAVDDKTRAWIHGTYAVDSGIPLVVINHGTAEENGMRLLNRFLQKTFPEIEFVHFNQGGSYKWILA